jgi:hypothetical protein
VVAIDADGGEVDQRSRLQRSQIVAEAGEDRIAAFVRSDRDEDVVGLGEGGGYFFWERVTRASLYTRTLLTQPLRGYPLPTRGRGRSGRDAPIEQQRRDAERCDLGQLPGVACSSPDGLQPRAHPGNGGARGITQAEDEEPHLSASSPG